MIDPARVIAANLWIDYFAVFQAEIERVRVVLVVGSGFPGNALACVFDNASAFGNKLAWRKRRDRARRTRGFRFVRLGFAFCFSSPCAEELSRNRGKLGRKN
jgi:hypothetical protein